MKNWTKEEALSTLTSLIGQIEGLKSESRNSANHMRWIANTLRTLQEVFGQNSTYYNTLSYFTWKETGSMIIREVWDHERAIESKHNIAYQNQLEQAKGLLLAAKDHLEQSEIEEVYDGENTAPEASEFIQIINLGENKLRKLIRSTPEKEREVQDKYEDLLIANDISYSREFPHIEYSSKQYIPDFSIKKLDLAIEIKLCKKDEKSFIAQINDDILAYKTVFKNIIFVIYDLGQIRDVDIFKNSLEKHSDVIVQIIKE
ncbi:hypothetical protein IX49_14630 [Cellulophaga lytica]|uniref:PD-(D/E)XK nuclease domain-containing protein n=1 Tax=Cellulophaga lytica TaxID=979 RepID=UPI0004F5CF3B|nr:hypothetical protein [Cellulophaga lytica]AIM61701.1 hypothetical protein IX49_14630 [Cellulophaga lytica]